MPRWAVPGPDRLAGRCWWRCGSGSPCPESRLATYGGLPVRGDRHASRARPRPVDRLAGRCRWRCWTGVTVLASVVGDVGGLPVRGDRDEPLQGRGPLRWAAGACWWRCGSGSRCPSRRWRRRRPVRPAAARPCAGRGRAMAESPGGHRDRDGDDRARPRSRPRPPTSTPPGPPGGAPRPTRDPVRRFPDSGLAAGHAVPVPPRPCPSRLTGPFAPATRPAGDRRATWPGPCDIVLLTVPTEQSSSCATCASDRSSKTRSTSTARWRPVSEPSASRTAMRTATSAATSPGRRAGPARPRRLSRRATGGGSRSPRCSP